MGAKEIKQKLFGDFINYLKTMGVNDGNFSMDVWMSKAFDILYAEYLKQIETSKEALNVLNKIPIEYLEKIIKEKKEIQKKRQDDENKASKEIEKERKNVIDLQNKKREKENNGKDIS